MRAAGERLTVVVSGMVAGDPHQGGATWAVLQYVLGLRGLGHRVVLVEPVAEAKLGGAPLGSSAPADYFRSVVQAYGLEAGAALLLAGTTQTVGISYAQLAAAASEADLLINVAGMLEDPELTGAVGRRAYLDLDPAFTQLWHDVSRIDMRLGGHEAHATVGLTIGDASCSVPTCGLSWVRTLPPVALAHWPPGDVLAHDAFTTVGNWRGYGSIDHAGVRYGQRAHSMREMADLPRLSPERFAVALAIHPDEVDDVDLLRRNGWRLLDPRRVAGTPGAFTAFVRASKAEIGVAKSGYVASRCGWFSDRSAAYLGAARPVVVQDTGFGDALPIGDGLLTFTTAEEAADAVARVAADYERHRRAARRIAEEHLSATVVLPRLLDALLA